MSVNLTQSPHTKMQLDEAFDYCARITDAHYENFPVASLFLPEEKRPYIQAIYAFSRTADDFADEPGLTVSDRIMKLNQWEENLELCFEGQADHPVFVALAETVRRLEIPIEPLRNLLIAFKRDVTQHSYETFDDLLSYCSCSANPIGRLVLMVFGYRDEKLFQLSDKICTALQLTNFWQDVKIDRERDRLYIPFEDFREFGYSLDRWENGIVDESFRALMKHEVNRTRSMFYEGAELPSSVDRDLQLELKLVWFGGMSILKKIEKARYDIHHYRPALSTFGKLSVLFRGLLFNDLTRYGKKRKPWDLT